MKFEMIVKSGLTTLAKVTGRPLSDDEVTLSDVSKVVEVEYFLEKLLGLRVHIREAEIGEEPKVGTLDQLKEAIAAEAGLKLENKEKGLCVACGEPALLKCKTDAARREFYISGLCGECRDKIFVGGEDG